ncbi:olfactory receptor 7G2-like [Loxodonta africana]|uniref:olfactory receptor 7G2-like n=1 Tax=Loxodonta africana TaxID=9785 RepID=UPI0030D2B319
MESENQTGLAEFLLLGLSENPELQPLLFGMFLTLYLITVAGNLLIILAISSDSHLHTPMYFFLSNLSFSDICFSTTTVPKILVNIQTQSKSISYTGCLTQICFVLVFPCLENCLLAVMAYDRYVAICHPLRYTIIMNPHLCGLLILLSLLVSIMSTLLHSLMVLHLSFLIDLEIPQFFCELPQVLKLACSDTLFNNILLYFMTTMGYDCYVTICPPQTYTIIVNTCLYGLLSLLSLLISIVNALLHSLMVLHPSFCTDLEIPHFFCELAQIVNLACSDTIINYILVYFVATTGFGVYISSAFTHSSSETAVASVMYSVVPQMMNPFIYSLRNRDMTGALRKITSRIPSF